MSNNNQRGSKTITGEDTLEVDEINIVGDGIGINGNFGQSGQVVKKSTIDNSIGWFDEQTFTAVLPIKLENGQISFDNSGATSNKVSISTSGSHKTLHIGNTISLQENNGFILSSIVDTEDLHLRNNGDIGIFDATSTRKLTLSKDGISVVDDTRYFNIGATNFRIGNIFCNNITGQNITASGNFTATSTGSIFADLQITGDLDCDGNILGDGATNISGIAHITTDVLLVNGNLNAGGNIQGDTQTNITAMNEIQSKTTKTKIFKIYSDDALTQQKLAYDGVSDNLQGSGNTDISSINNIIANTFNFSNTLLFDGNQLLVGSGPHIHKTNGIDMNGTPLTEASGITGLTGNIDMNNQSITSCNNITCSTITLSGEISSSNIPSTIAGSKTFTGTIQTNGNTTLCKNSGDLFIGDLNQALHSRPVATFMSSIFRKFNTQTDLVGLTGGISGRLEFMRRNRTQERSYFSPYQVKDYYTPSMPGYLYDHTTKLTGDTNRTPYRVIKLHPTDWTANEDSSFNDIAIQDPGTYATTGNITYGGLQARHSTIIEAWCYIDIPEGYKFRAIFMRVASSTAGTSYVARNVKVFKRHIGEHFKDAPFSVKIVDGNTATSGNTPVYPVAGITDQDLVNEYDNSMAVRIETGNLNYVIAGGYIICDAVNPDNLFYTIAITSGNTHHANFTAKVLDDLSPNTELASQSFTAKNQTKNFIIPYNYGIHRRFFIKFNDADDGEDYNYDLTCNLCVVNSLSSVNIDSGDNNFIELFRQNPTISFNQIAV